MSDKEFNSMIDFQLILDELEKISHKNPEIALKFSQQSVSETFENLKKEAIEQALEDVDNIFRQSVRRSVETLDQVPEPLSEIESKAFDSKYDRTVREIELLKKKIEFGKEILMEKIKEEQAYDLSLENRRDTAKAARKFFNEKKKVITYEDYLVAKEYKESQHELEVRALLKNEEE